MANSNPQAGEKHFTSTVFIRTDETEPRFLLVHHRKFNFWMPPGGHIEWDENPYEAAIRETFEETNVNIRPFLPEPHVIDERAIFLPAPTFLLEEVIEARGDQPDHFHLDHIYVVTVPHQKVTHRASESHGIDWFSVNQIRELPTFKNVHYLIDRILSSQ